MNKKILFIISIIGILLISLMFGSYLFTKNTSVTFYPILENGKWGFIDYSGKVKIKPQFSEARSFKEGLAVVRIGEKYGFIDDKGKMKIECQFDRVTDFKDGLAVIKIKENYGYIDKTGKIIIKPEFDIAQPFNEGLAGVSVGRKYWGYINKKGNFVIKPIYSFGGVFNNGIAAVYNFDKKWGYIDKKGKQIIDFKFDNVSTYISFQNDPVLPEYRLMEGFFSEDLCAVRQNGKCGFINKKGEFIIKPQFDDANNFSEGLALVGVNGKYGYINKSGKFVVEAKYDDARFFHDGLACVRFGKTPTSNWGFIDKTGKVVIQPKYSEGASFNNGIALVEQSIGYAEDHYQYINKEGKAIIKTPRDIYCERASQFDNGLAMLWESSESFVYIDKNGKVVWKPTNISEK